MTSRRTVDFDRIDPRTYLDLSRTLAGDGSPASQRSAGDRAYYAAFLTTRDVLAEKGYITPHLGLEDHRYVQEQLKRVVGAIGNDEQRLRTARNKVTYDTGTVSPGSLNWMISTAENIIRLVDGLPRSSSR